MPILHSSGVMTPGQFGPIKASFLAFHVTFHFDHIQNRNTFRDTDDKIKFRINRFHNRISSEWSRYIDNRCIRACCFYSFCNCIEYRYTPSTSCSAFARCYSADNLRAVFKHLFCMEKTCCTCNTLSNHFRIFINKYAHVCSPLPIILQVITIFCAPSAIDSAAVIFKPDSFKIFLPSSTFVPSRRTTSGTSRPIA